MRRLALLAVFSLALVNHARAALPDFSKAAPITNVVVLTVHDKPVGLFLVHADGSSEPIDIHECVNTPSCADAVNAAIAAGKAHTLDVPVPAAEDEDSGTDFQGWDPFDHDPAHTLTQV